MMSEFKKCSICGSIPKISLFKGAWELSCKCGRTIPGGKSEDQLLRAWNRIIEREELENEKTKKRSHVRRSV